MVAVLTVVEPRDGDKCGVYPTNSSLVGMKT